MRSSRVTQDGRNYTRPNAARIEFVTAGGEIMKPLDTTLDYRLIEISSAFFDRVKY